MLDDNKTIYKMSNITRNLLCYYNFNEIKKIRKENYKYLNDNLRKNDFIKYTLGDLENSEVPLYYPIMIKQRRKNFQKFMSNMNIYLPIIWPKDEKNLANIQNYMADNIYSNIICIPCDQRYNVYDMQRVIDTINIYRRKK